MNKRLQHAFFCGLLVFGLMLPTQLSPLASPAYADPPAPNTAPVLTLPTGEQRPEQGKPYAFKLDIKDDSTPLKDLKVEADAYIDVYTTFDGTDWYVHVDTEDITDAIRVTIRVTDAQGLTAAGQLRIWVKAEKPYMHPTIDRYFRVNKEIEKILVHPIDGLPTDVVKVDGLPPGLTWDPKASPNPRRPSQTFITGTPTTPGTYTVTERLMRNENGKETEVAKLDFKITILATDAPRIAADFTLPEIKAVKGDKFTNNFRIQHKHGEFPYSQMKFEADDPRFTLKRAHDNWEITVNTDEVFGPMRVKITMVEPDGVRTEKWTTAEVVDPAINAAPDLRLPKKTLYPVQGKPFRYRLNVKDDKTARKDLKIDLETTLNSKAEFDGQHWYLVVDTAQPSKEEPVTVHVTDQAGLKASGKMNVQIKGAAAPPPPPPPGGPGGPGNPPPAPSPTPASTVEGTRFAGESRVETAVEISKKRQRAGRLNTAFIARADIFADAVASTPLAHRERASLYLTQPDRLHAATAAELKRALSSNGKIVVLGGEKAISEAVVGELKALFPAATIERIAGLNRYDTAAMIHKQLGSPKVVAIVDGDPSAVADALIAGTAMAIHTDQGKPAPGSVLFAAKTALAPETSAVVTGAPPQKVFNYTGISVSAGEVKTISGEDPVARSINTAKAMPNLDPTAVAIMPSKEANQVDGMAGGVDAANQGAMLFGAPNGGDDKRLAQYFDQLGTPKPIRFAVVYGGPQAISDEAMKAIFSEKVNVDWSGQKPKEIYWPASQ